MTRPGPASRDGGGSGAKAIILIAVLAVLAIFVLSRTSGHAAVASKGPSHATASTAPPSTAPPPSTTPTTVLPAAQVKVQVLNGVLTGSLAGQWTAKLKANPGYDTLTPDNATAKVSASIIYVLTPGYTAEGQALAAAVGLPASAVSPTSPPPTTAPIPASERASANLVLIIGPDLAATA